MRFSKKSLLVFLTILFSYHVGECQKLSKNGDYQRIEQSITKFLNWYKVQVRDTTIKMFPLIKGGYPDTSTKTTIDKAGLALYFKYLRNSGFFSETYINNLQVYFLNIDMNLRSAPKQNALVAIPGLDSDWILSTFEPEMILDHLKAGRVDKIDLIYNKAIARLRISNIVKLIFTLTKVNGKWKIDYIGFDNTAKYSLGRE